MSEELLDWILEKRRQQGKLVTWRKGIAEYFQISFNQLTKLSRQLNMST